MSFAYLEQLRKGSPAWRLLASTQAPFITAFLFQEFIAKNRREIAQLELIGRLDDFIYQVNLNREDPVFTRTGREYLDDWANDQHGWLRKFYPSGQDEPHYDITSQVQKAVDWLLSLKQQPFIGTESRLITVFELLRQIVAGVESNPDQRLAELQRQKDEIEHEMKLVAAGEMTMLNDTQIKERFWQAMSTAREILSDFRAVEHNFRELDRDLRERIAIWDKGKGELLETIFSEKEGISQSEQGKSFAAFWRFLMSSDSQDDFSDTLERVLLLKPVQEMGMGVDSRNVHQNWVKAGAHVQETVAMLSQQLRHYVDENYIAEERRINQILREIESKALSIRNSPPAQWHFEIDGTKSEITLPMDRPLYTPRTRVEIVDDIIDTGIGDFSAESLFSQIYVDKEKLHHQIEHLLQTQDMATIAQITAHYPLKLGLNELITYLVIADESYPGTYQTGDIEEIFWEDEEGTVRLAKIPKILFTRTARSEID